MEASHKKHRPRIEVGKDAEEEEQVTCDTSRISRVFGRGGSVIGDSLVFIFPLATMLTFTSAIGKLNVRVSWHHHMLLQVISQSYCQVFVKSYNFVFEKIDIEYAPYQKWQKNRSFCTHPLQINTPPTCTCFVKNPPENCVSA